MVYKKIKLTRFLQVSLNFYLMHVAENVIYLVCKMLEI